MSFQKALEKLTHLFEKQFNKNENSFLTLSKPHVYYISNINDTVNSMTIGTFWSQGREYQMQWETCYAYKWPGLHLQKPSPRN